MPITMSCSRCFKNYSIPDDKARKKIACPVCKTALEIGPALKKTPSVSTQPDFPSLPDENLGNLGDSKLKGISKSAVKNKKGVGFFIVVGILGGLVLTLGGVGGFYYFSKNTSETKVQTPKTVTKKVSKIDLSSIIVKARTSDQVFKELLPSALWVVGSFGSGSGSLVHADQGLVLTSYSVINDEFRDAKLTAFFPDQTSVGLELDPIEYFRAKDVKGTKARVVYRDESRDLALLKIDSVPPKAVPIALSRKSAEVGSKIYSIGSSFSNNYLLGLSKGSLWRFSALDVRKVFSRDFTYKSGQKMSSVIVETQSTSDYGDCGGPLVNERVELVGMASGYVLKDKKLGINVDITEVRGFLSSYFRSRGQEWVDVRPSTPGFIGSEEKPQPPSFWLEVLQEGDQPQIEVAKAMLVQFGAKALPELRESFKDPSKNVRLNGLECAALMGIKASGLVSDLQELISDTDDDIQIASIRALGVIGPGGKVAVPLLIKNLTDDNNKVRDAAVSTLGRFLPFNEKDLPTFTPLLSHEEPLLREFAIRSISEMKLPSEDIYKLIQPKYQDKIAEVRRVAVRSSNRVAKAYKDKVVSEVFKLSADENEDVRNEVSDLLRDAGPYTSKEMEPYVQYLGPQSDPKLRNQAVKLITAIDGDLAVYIDGFIYALNEKDRENRLLLLKALSKMVSTQALKIGSAVIPLVADDDKPVQEAAKKVMDQISITSSDELKIFGDFLKSNNKLQVRLQTLNILIGSKNFNWDSAVKDLASCLSDKEPDLKKAALKAASLAGNSAKDLAPEIIALTKEQDINLRLDAFKALSVIGRDPKAMTCLMAGLTNTDNQVYEVCLTGIKELKPPLAPKDIEFLKVPLVSESKNAKVFVLKTLALFGKESGPLLMEVCNLLKDIDVDVKLGVLEVLAFNGMGSKDKLQNIIDIAKVELNPTSDQIKLRKQAFLTLLKLAPECGSVVNPLSDLVDSKDNDISSSALIVLGAMGKEAVPALGKMMAAFNNRILLPTAAEQISKLGKDAVKPLIKGLESTSPEVRLGCVVALGKMGPIAKEAAPSLSKVFYQDKVPLLRSEAKIAQTKVQSGN